MSSISISVMLCSCQCWSWNHMGMWFLISGIKLHPCNHLAREHAMFKRNLH